MHNVPRFPARVFGRFHAADVFVVLAVSGFSAWLMWHTFGYDTNHREILIAAKAWSDFGAHIPMIRSFSLGSNWPPQYPIFPGEPIRYHFMFYLLVGLLEKTGLSLGWALNLPSAIGFAGMLLGLYALSVKLFRSRAVAVLSILFAVFNGSLTFLRFFALHPLSAHSLRDIAANGQFVSFAPWGPGDISAFWTLNIFTNQRHLGAAFAIGIAVIFLVMHIRSLRLSRQLPWVAPTVLLIGLLPYFHQPVLVLLGIFLALYFILFPELRIFLLFTGLGSFVAVIPQLLPLLNGSSQTEWYPGYLMHNSLSFGGFFRYWFDNIGLHLFLIPAGFALAPKTAKKALTPLFFIFALGFLVKFSVEPAANHKFFNFYVMLGGMCTAYTLVRLWRQAGHWHPLPHAAARTTVLAAVVALILSGIIDFFPVKNDFLSPIRDVGNDPTATWIARNTPKTAVFLNSEYLYHPASLAGRKILLGWPYFPWSAGYETLPRTRDMKTMYESRDPKVFCPLLHTYGITYITVEDSKNDPNLPVIPVGYFRSAFRAAYTAPDGSISVYAVPDLCGQ